MKRALLTLAVIVAALAFLFAPAICYAQTCRPGTVCRPPAVVVTATPVVTATQIVVPVYGAVYAPTYGGSTDETNRLLADMQAELKGLRADLVAMKGGAAQPRDPRPMLKASCARCHTDGALADGTDFAIFDDAGELRDLSGLERKVMRKRLTDGTMPPPVKDASGLMTQKMVAADRGLLADLLKNPAAVARAPAREPAPTPAPVIPPAVPSGASLKLPDVPLPPEQKK